MPEEPRSPYELRRSRRVVVDDGVCLDLVDELRAAVLARASSGASCPTLNKGGWRSDELFHWPDPAVRRLRHAVEDRVRVSPRGLVGWAMVNRLGDYHPRHTHQTAVVSGIFVVDPGPPPHTPTLFETGDADGREVAVDPVPGRLVLFPGQAWHRVPRVEGAGPRVTIAFDVRG